MQHIIFFALGSNLGDKQKNIEDAYNKIEERIGRITSVSALHITMPEEFESDHLFVNSVCEVVSELDVNTVFAITQEIEKEIGRSEKSKNGVYNDRIIDIDLLMMDDLVLNAPGLTLPHPRFHLRNFVLDPFCEIAPDVVHPVLKKTIRELRLELDRRQED